MKKLFICFILFSATVLFAAPKHLIENDWSKKLAPKYHAKREYVLWDKTRIDLLTDKYAIEIDFAHKWAESLGQAEYYSIVSGKKPAILLLTKKGEERYVYRAQTVAAKYEIRVFIEWID